MTKPFRFGLSLAGIGDRSSVREKIKRAEDAGFDVICTADHIARRMGTLPLLTFAAENSNLRVSPMVIANDYHHPVLLARDAATLDILSDGRFELGIGTGWIQAQYETAGIRYDPPGARVDRLTEAIAIIKGCWGGRRFSFAGEHYRVDNLGLPVPVQKPHPPILIGGSGRRMLTLAGREADIVGFTITRGMTGFDTFGQGVARSSLHIDEQISWVRDTAGDRFDNIELSVMIHHYAADDDELEEMADKTKTDLQTVQRSPHVLTGPPGRIVEQLIERRERWGLSYIVVMEGQLDAIEPAVKELART